MSQEKLFPDKNQGNLFNFFFNWNIFYHKFRLNRFKILATGDLMIANLQFKDMGTYICLAKSVASKAVISTFLYPLAEKK